jgi:hypothetical protein
MADFEIAGSALGDILVLTFTGRSTPQNAAAMTRRYFELLLASGRKKVLADIRPLQGRLSAGQTYFLVRDLPVKPVPADIQTAVVEAGGNREYAAFLEATAANAGVALKSFLDYDEAIAWLRTPEASPSQA